MRRVTFIWDPLGVKRLSFKDFHVFPISPRKQLAAGLLSMTIIIVGSLAGSALPVPNFNLVIWLLVGYFLAARVHPHPLVGPAAITLSIVGLGWGLVMFVPDPAPELPALVMLALASNLFVAMSVGALVGAILRPKYS